MNQTTGAGLKNSLFVSPMGISNFVWVWLMVFSWSGNLFAENIKPQRSVSHRVNECQTWLAKPLEFNPIIERMWIANSNPGSNIATYRDEDVVKFVKATWPFLKQIASESGTTVSEMIDDYLALDDLIVKESAEFGQKKMERRLGLNEAVRRGLRHVETIPDGAKLKRPQWKSFGEVYRGINQLAVLAFQIETSWRKNPTLDPFAFLSEDQVLRILFSLEISSLDNVVKYVEARRARKEQLANPSPPIKETEEPIPAVMLRRSPSDPLASIDAGWIRSLGQPKVSVPKDLFEETNLARVVLNDLEIKEGITYSARTIWGRDLSVSFSKSVIKDYKNGDRENIRTLLRAVINGRGDRAGVKWLGDIGPKIVEVKGYLAGHLRLIGCLDGQQLFLKLLDTMPDTRAGYFKKISPNFCD